MPEGLEISSGSNKGEAAFLGPSSYDPIRASENFIHLNQQRNLLDRRDEQRNAALLTDDIKTQWATDDLNYFQPKLQAIKNKAIEMFRKTHGHLDPYQRAELQGDYDKLKNEALINTKIKENYNNKIHALDEDKTGFYDKDVSRHTLEQWNNPNAVPELNKDIQENYGGNINAWRAANEHKFQLSEAYNFNKHNSDEVFKGVKLNKKAIDPVMIGNGIYKSTVIEAPDEQDLKTRVLGMVDYPNQNLKSARWNDRVGSIVNSVVESPVTRDKDGKEVVVGYHSDNPAYQNAVNRVWKKHGELNSAAAQKDLKVEIGVEIGKSLYPTKEDPSYHYPAAKGDRAAKETTTIATHYNNVAEQIQQAPNMSPDQVAEQLGGRANIDKNTGTYTVELPVAPSTKPFVTVPQNQILTRPNNTWKFVRNKNVPGQVAGTVTSNQLMWKDHNGVTVTPNTPGAKPFAQLVYNPVVTDVSTPEKLTSAFLLFTDNNPNTNITKETYKQMLENNETVGSQFKVEYDLTDPAQRTYYDQALGGTSISQTAFNRTAKASKEQGSHQVKSVKGKETPAQRAARIAAGG